MADKSVLEKYYDDKAKKRRAPTSKEMERDAIEPDTTLEGLLIGPGIPDIRAQNEFLRAPP